MRFQKSAMMASRVKSLEAMGFGKLCHAIVNFGVNSLPSRNALGVFHRIVSSPTTHCCVRGA
jgi:hypothetical protein